MPQRLFPNAKTSAAVPCITEMPDSLARKLAEAARLLEAFGAETRIFNPSGLPLPDDAPVGHPKVQELRELSAWSEG